MFSTEIFFYASQDWKFQNVLHFLVKQPISACLLDDARKPALSLSRLSLPLVLFPAWRQALLLEAIIQALCMSQPPPLHHHYQYRTIIKVENFFSEEFLPMKHASFFFGSGGKSEISNWNSSVIFYNTEKKVIVASVT